jgi:uncharacterized cupredoxin-like copper-binding protein
MLNKTTMAVLMTSLLITGALGRISAGASASQIRADAAKGTAPTPSMASAPSSSMEQTVEVRLTEYKIEMPLQLHAGRTLFKVTNTGEMFHSLEIEGKGIEKEVESGVDAGQTKTLKLDLKPGTYEVYCPVHGHKKAGMSLKVQVT